MCVLAARRRARCGRQCRNAIAIRNCVFLLALPAPPALPALFARHPATDPPEPTVSQRLAAGPIAFTKSRPRHRLAVHRRERRDVELHPRDLIRQARIAGGCAAGGGSCVSKRSASNAIRSAGRYAISMPSTCAQRLHVVDAQDALVVGDDVVLLDGFVVVALGHLGRRPHATRCPASSCAARSSARRD